MRRARVRAAPCRQGGWGIHRKRIPACVALVPPCHVTADRRRRILGRRGWGKGREFLVVLIAFVYINGLLPKVKELKQRGVIGPLFLDCGAFTINAATFLIVSGAYTDGSSPVFWAYSRPLHPIRAMRS